MAKKDDYEVGYGKPPKRNQFQRGQSGNPSGTKKVAADGLYELSLKEGKRRRHLELGGKKVTLTQWEIVIKKLWAKAMNGDVKAFQIIQGIEANARAAGIDQQDRTIQVTIDFEEPPVMRPCVCELRDILKAERESYESCGLKPPVHDVEATLREAMTSALKCKNCGESLAD
jgi:hypothetical protein